MHCDRNSPQAHMEWRRDDSPKSNNKCYQQKGGVGLGKTPPIPLVLKIL